MTTPGTPPGRSARNHSKRTMVTGTPDYAGVAKQVMRGDLYEEAMKEIGYAHAGASLAPETFFDGKTFDPADPEKYAKSFEVHSVKG